MKITVQPITEDRIGPMPDTTCEPTDDCPRCGEDHGKLLYSRFKRPPNGRLGKLLYWSICPNTGEPILAEIE